MKSLMVCWFLLCITAACAQESPFGFGETDNPFASPPAIRVSITPEPFALAAAVAVNPFCTNYWDLVVCINSAFLRSSSFKPEIRIRLDNGGVLEVQQFVNRFRDWTQKCYSNDISEATKEIGRIGGLTYTFRYNSNAGFHSAWVESGPNIHLSWDDISAIRALLNLYPGAVQQLRARISSAPIEKLRVDDLLK